jgi:hypothetical protein
MKLRVSERGKAIVALRLKRRIACASGTVRSVRVGTFRQRRVFLHVHRDGTFSGRTRLRRSRGSDVVGGRLNMNGRFLRRGRRVRGSFRERPKLNDGMSCDTGVVNFSLRLRR